MGGDEGDAEDAGSRATRAKSTKGGKMKRANGKAARGLALLVIEKWDDARVTYVNGHTVRIEDRATRAPHRLKELILAALDDHATVGQHGRRKVERRVAVGHRGQSRPRAVRVATLRDNPGTFDDKAIIVEAGNRNQPRGAALPLLMDLARKPSFLHDDSVKSLDALLDPAARPVGSPHAFYVTDPAERALVVKFLKSLDDKPLP
jgi:hypothetical protein